MTAVEKPGLLDGYRWMHAAALIYCAAIALWSVCAYIADNMIGRAIVCAGAQVLGIILAVLSIRSMRGEMPWVGALQLALSLACCWVASLGVLHAWTRDGGQLSDLLAFWISAMELITIVSADYVADKLKERDDRKRRAAEEDARLEAERLAESEHRRELERLAAEARAAAAVSEAASRPVQQPLQTGVVHLQERRQQQRRSATRAAAAGAAAAAALLAGNAAADSPRISDEARALAEPLLRNGEGQTAALRALQAAGVSASRHQVQQLDYWLRAQRAAG